MIFSVADAPLSSVVRLSEFYLTHAHTLEHMFFEEYVYHGTHHSKEMRKKKFFSVFVIYLFINLFQARRRLLYVMYISFRSTIYMHFVSFFCFLCNIIHRLV